MEYKEFILDDNHFTVTYEIEDNSYDDEFGKVSKLDLILKEIKLYVPYVEDEWIDILPSLNETTYEIIFKKVVQALE